MNNNEKKEPILTESMVREFHLRRRIGRIRISVLALEQYDFEALIKIFEGMFVKHIEFNPVSSIYSYYCVGQMFDEVDLGMQCNDYDIKMTKDKNGKFCREIVKCDNKAEDNIRGL